MMRVFPVVVVSAVLSLASGCTLHRQAPLGGAGSLEGEGTPPTRQAHGLRYLTILSTNDIHGALEPRKDARGTRGGMALVAGAVNAARSATRTLHGEAGGVLLLDGGDQFQGTLMSNYSEGALLYSVMDRIGYDAVVPGNHAFDFGPRGWLVDKVTPETEDQNPRGVIEGLAKSVRFPMLSATIYELSSLRDTKGNPVQAEGVGCKAAAGVKIDFKNAKRPAFLAPYRIQTVAGVRVALIGLDHPESPKTTTPENVADLCFRDPVEQYRETRAELEGQADVYVILLHNGDTSQSKAVSAALFKLLEESPRAFDLVVAGHTHAVNHETSTQGVRLVQSGSSAERIGRVDLVYDAASGRVLHERTRSAAGVILQTRDCEQKAYFCTLDASGKVLWDGIALEADAEIARAIREGSAEVSALSQRELGVADEAIRRHRTDESPLANLLTDIFRSLSGAEVTFMNTGGIRVDLLQGPVTYGAFFEVLPFNNRGVQLQPMGFDRVYSLLLRSIQTCGSYGALMQSGLRVEYTRDCTGTDTIDPVARLERISTVGGELLYDREQGVHRSDRNLTVATLDFLAAGGSGYDGFKGVPQVRDLGVVREAMTEYLLQNPGRFQSKTDGRWLNRKVR